MAQIQAQRHARPAAAPEPRRRHGGGILGWLFGDDDDDRRRRRRRAPRRPRRQLIWPSLALKAPCYKAAMRRFLTALFLLLRACLRRRCRRAPTHITFVTDWKAQAEHGGFYEALAEGLYAKRGLDVTIREGGPDVNVPQLLAGGAADFGIGSNAFM